MAEQVGWPPPTIHADAEPGTGAPTRLLWNAYAAVYDLGVTRLAPYQQLQADILDAVRTESARLRAGRDPAPVRLVDLCCGTGNHLARLLRCLPDLQATGIDLSPAMLRIARRKCRSQKPVRWLCGDAGQALAALPQASQDLVVISNAFYAQPRQADLLARIRRVLHPEGALLLTDPWRGAGLLTLLAEHLRARGPVGLFVLPLLGPSFVISLLLERHSSHTFSSPQRTRALLQDAGFAVHHESRTYGQANYLLIARRAHC